MWSREGEVDGDIERQKGGEEKDRLREIQRDRKVEKRRRSGVLYRETERWRRE